MTASTSCDPPAASARRLARRLRRFVALLCWVVAVGGGSGMLAPAAAHKASDAYLFLDSRDGSTSLRWDIALRDLDAALALDTDGDRNLTWAEVRRAWPRVDAFALAALAVPGCRFSIADHALERRSDGAYAVLKGRAPCRVDAASEIRYALFADLDPTHRGLLRLSIDGAAPVARMLLPAALPAATDAVGTGPATSAPAVPDAHRPAFIGEGMHHILTGYDHLLFLLCLLLPAVLQRRDGCWQPVTGWREALWPVARTVTLFTLAHSVTLALAATGRVDLSPSLVEPAIALTIMLAAFDNLRPLLLRWRGLVTFLFGLVHGFGFAGVLREMDLPTAQFGWALLQFNLGIELGQLSLVLLVVPLLFVLRERRAYVPGVLGAGSALALVVALGWVVERTTDWRVLPF